MNINGIRTQGVTNIYASNGARKIKELKAKIQNGTYNVDAKLTAQSILNNIKEGR